MIWKNRKSRRIFGNYAEEQKELHQDRDRRSRGNIHGSVGVCAAGRPAHRILPKPKHDSLHLRKQKNFLVQS